MRSAARVDKVKFAARSARCSYAAAKCGHELTTLGPSTDAVVDVERFDAKLAGGVGYGWAAWTTAVGIGRTCMVTGSARAGVLGRGMLGAAIGRAGAVCEGSGGGAARAAMASSRGRRACALEVSRRLSAPSQMPRGQAADRASGQGRQRRDSVPARAPDNGARRARSSVGAISWRHRRANGLRSSADDGTGVTKTSPTWTWRASRFWSRPIRKTIPGSAGPVRAS